MKGRLLLALSLVFLGSLFSAPVFSREAYDEGLDNYYAGRYEEAAVCFSRATDQDPDDPSAHYYLANSLAYLEDHEDAVEEYQICYQLAPHGKLAGYCQVGIRRFAAAASEEQRQKQTGPGRPLFGAAHIGPGQDLRILHRTLDTVHRQADSDKERVRRAWANTADAAMRTGEERARRIQEQAEQDIADIRGAFPHRLTRYQQALIDEVNHSSALAVNSARQNAQIEARRHMRQGVEHALALEIAAANLESQLIQGPSRSGVMLQPAGTSLYVRNYEYFEPEALAARQEKLKLQSQASVVAFRRATGLTGRSATVSPANPGRQPQALIAVPLKLKLDPRLLLPQPQKPAVEPRALMAKPLKLNVRSAVQAETD